MDFTIKFANGKTQTYENVRGLHIIDGVWHVVPNGRKKKIEVMASDIDVIFAHVQPSSKIRSVIKAQTTLVSDKPKCTSVEDDKNVE